MKWDAPPNPWFGDQRIVPRHRGKSNPTGVEVRAAVRAFIDRGGIIHTLPPQPTPDRTDWDYALWEYDAYESLHLDTLEFQ
jgi:hypothetical protein